jgi:hypothetical protein
MGLIHLGLDVHRDTIADTGSASARRIRADHPAGPLSYEWGRPPTPADNFRLMVAGDQEVRAPAQRLNSVIS